MSASPDWLADVRFNDDGLVIATAVDAVHGGVLMQAWMNAEALRRTVAEGHAVYWSRSRGRLWRKGETSGHVQRVRAVRLDCDGDGVLLEVEQVGGVACHTGRANCFHRRLEAERWVVDSPVLIDPATLYGEAAGHGSGPQSGPTPGRVPTGANEVLAELWTTLVARRSADPRSSYVAGLYARGLDAILKKVGEEAAETIIAAKGSDRAAVVRETADLWFHCLVMLAHLDTGPADVLAELENRMGRSGLEEKAARLPPTDRG